MHSFEYQTYDISYKINGTGPVLLLIHGFLEDHTIFKEISMHFQKDYKIIEIDLPGHGLSKTINQPITMDQISHIIGALIEKLQLKTVTIIGHSLGAYVGLATIRNFPSLVNGICIFHATANNDTEEKKINRNRAIELVEQNQSRFLSSFIPNLFAKENVQQYQSEILALMERSQSIASSSIIRIIEAMRDRADERKTLKDFKGNKHYIIGKEDPVVACTDLRAQASETDASYTILENTGHMGFIEAKEAVIISLEKFLEKN